MKVYPVQDNSLYLELTQPLFSYDEYADGLYLKEGAFMKNGEEIQKRKNGPLQRYPALNCLL